ncbi:hypothetical protein PV325_003153 [Microctonus aethiopoides]|nr:hypothetical protein PV325_003153 [Microctonus aethiopoides]
MSRSNRAHEEIGNGCARRVTVALLDARLMGDEVVESRSECEGECEEPSITPTRGRRMEAPDGSRLPILVGDVLALRGAGLATTETWALLCQAAQALQDLFLSNGGVIGGGSRVGPVVTPHTLELTPRGRVMLQIAPQETARAYLPPEYRPGRLYSDTDSEKMWMYSLGRALLDTTPRLAALTGSVSVSPTSALQSVLAAMTEPDPQRRASLMNLLDVISEYCHTRMLTKPFTLIVIDMYREVVRSSQYAVRMRDTCHLKRQPQIYSPYYYYYNHRQYDGEQQQNKNKQLIPSSSLHFLKYHGKANFCKYQTQNSRSHPNLSCLLPMEPHISNNKKPQFQSQLNIKSNCNEDFIIDSQINHSRTYSQPIYSQCSNELIKIQSNHNLVVWDESNKTEIVATIASAENDYSSASSDPIYAFPVKPFLTSHDIRVNRLIAKRSKKTSKKNDVHAQPTKSRVAQNDSNDTGSQLNMIAAVGINMDTKPPPLLSSPDNNIIYHDRLLSDDVNRAINSFGHQYSQSSNSHHTDGGDKDRQVVLKPMLNIGHSQRNSSLSVAIDNAYRAVSSNQLKSNTVHQSRNNNSTLAPPKPPRIGIRNGPRARRGKPIQRAPSRLYCAITGPIRCLNKTQCVGPEFVVRACQPPKSLKVGDSKNSNDNRAGRIVIILLSGQRIDVICDSHKTTAGELFQAVIRAEGLDDNFTLGLAALLAGDFVMLPSEIRLSKVSPPGWSTINECKGPLCCLPTSFMLYLRQRFFLPSLRGIRSWISKHLLYLQIRRCILEQQLICTLNQLINLTGLALQAEFGNYSVNEHACGNYFLLEHYIPETLILNHDYQHPQLLLNTDELRGQLHEAHRNRRGLDANTAEELFITHAQELEDYGLHLYIATTSTKELEKIIGRLRKYRLKNSAYSCDEATDPKNITNFLNNACQFNDISYPTVDYRKIQSTASHEAYYNIESKENIYAIPKNPSAIVDDVKINNSISCGGKTSATKKSETNVWFGIHSQGIKIFERRGEPRKLAYLVKLQWQDIKTLSYSKNSLVICIKYNGKRIKLKLNMEYKKSCYAFKLTSLHHQFFLKLRSELTSLQGLTRDFGVPLNPTLDSALAPKCKASKMKISTVNKQINVNENYPTSLEDYQNKENENPIILEKVATNTYASINNDDEPICYTPADDVIYAQVNARLEPEGASRDTEDESERTHIDTNNIVTSESKYSNNHTNKNWASHQSIDIMCVPTLIRNTPKLVSSNNRYNQFNENPNQPEELYAAINRSSKKYSDDANSSVSRLDKKWSVQYADIASKALSKVKTSSLPNYSVSKQRTDFRTPSLPRRLGVRMGTRAIYSGSHVPRDFSLSDDIELLSFKSETVSSIQSTFAQSSESLMPEAYVLNADIGIDDETFHISKDDTMSASLMARLEELSFVEERMLRTIKLERGHGGSIGLQVTEGNDGGVYVQAISVGGSADMAGNVIKGDKIIAINGSSLLNLRYQDALKMLQSSSCREIELVLSQKTSKRHMPTQSLKSNHIKQMSNVSSSANDSCLTGRRSSDKVLDVVPVHSDSVSSTSHNQYTQNEYGINIASPINLNSASMMVNLDDFDILDLNVNQIQCLKCWCIPNRQTYCEKKLDEEMQILWAKTEATLLVTFILDYRKLHDNTAFLRNIASQIVWRSWVDSGHALKRDIMNSPGGSDTKRTVISTKLIVIRDNIYAS